MNNKKIALVTGASRGIGAAIAARLSQEYFVVGTATTEVGAAAITAALEGRGVGMVLNVCDVDACTEVFEAIEKTHGPIAILVNNAGITKDNLILRMKLEDWSAVIDTNLRAVFLLSKLASRSMLKQRFGRIVNIASVVASSGNPGQANYAASKAGVIGLSKSLAQELGSRGVTVNVITPGFIETDMTKVLPETERAKLLEKIPCQRLGQPEEIAAAVAFLVSADAGYITGATVPVNGGMYMS